MFWALFLVLKTRQRIAVPVHPRFYFLIFIRTLFVFCFYASQFVEAKKYCWYFEGGYPIYFM